VKQRTGRSRTVLPRRFRRRCDLLSQWALQWVAADELSVPRQRQDYSTDNRWAAAHPNIDAQRFRVGTSSPDACHRARARTATCGSRRPMPLVTASRGNVINSAQSIHSPHVGCSGGSNWRAVRTTPIYLPSVAPGQWASPTPDALFGKEMVAPRERWTGTDRLAAAFVTEASRRTGRSPLRVDRYRFLIVAKPTRRSVPRSTGGRTRSRHAELHRRRRPFTDVYQGGVALTTRCVWRSNSYAGTRGPRHGDNTDIEDADLNGKVVAITGGARGSGWPRPTHSPGEVPCRNGRP